MRVDARASLGALLVRRGRRAGSAASLDTLAARAHLAPLWSALADKGELRENVRRSAICTAASCSGHRRGPAFERRPALNYAKRPLRRLDLGSCAMRARGVSKQRTRRAEQGSLEQAERPTRPAASAPAASSRPARSRSAPRRRTKERDTSVRIALSSHFSHGRASFDEGGQGLERAAADSPSQVEQGSSAHEQNDICTTDSGRDCNGYGKR